MNQLERASWTAALRLFDDSYTFVSVGPRIQADWREDVVPVLRRETVDPRGWDGMSWDEYDRTPDRPFFPFLPADATSLDSGLAEITAESAETLLVAMSAANSFRVSTIDDFTNQKESLLTQARALLSRFNPQSTLYSNSGYSRDSADHNFFESADWINPYSEHPFDLGLIVVSDDEVGVFWSFDAS